MKIHNDYNGKHLAETIKNLAKRKGISVKRLLSDLELGKNYMAQISNNVIPGVDKIVKIAQYLNCPIDYLLGVDDMENLVSNNTKAEPTPYIIAYLDILGTTEFVQKSPKESASVFDLIYGAILRVLAHFNTNPDPKLSNVGNIKCKTFSDNMVFAIECNDCSREKFLSNLTVLSTFVAMFQCQVLFQNGLFIRGGICYGDLYIDRNFVIGPGLIRAHEIECRESIYPRVLFDKSLVEKISDFLEDDSTTFAKKESVFPGANIYFIDYLNFGYLVDNNTEISNAGKKHYEILLKNEEENKAIEDETERNKRIKKTRWAKWYHNIFFAEYNVPLFDIATHPEADGQAKFSLKREIAAQFKESDASTHQIAAYGEGYVSESDENGEGEEIK